MAETKSNQQGGNPLKPGGDSPTHAPESGEPAEAGRQQGRPIDDKGQPPRHEGGGDVDLESGRHGTK